MARPPRKAQIRRIELRLATDDPLLRELAQEAELRRVELQQHIQDLLRGRYLLRRGQSLAELLWLPPSTTGAALIQSPASVALPVLAAAHAAATAWENLLGEGSLMQERDEAR